MNELLFCYFMDYEDGKMARLETTGEDYGIPFNVFIDNAAEMADAKEGLCTIDLCGIGSEIEVFASQEDYLEHRTTNLAPEAMIPIGTFPADPDDEQFKESPHILFTGEALSVAYDPNAGPNDPNCDILVKTLGFTFDLYIRWDDAPIETGSIVNGIAWLFGDLEMNADR